MKTVLTLLVACSLGCGTIRSDVRAGAGHSQGEAQTERSAKSVDRRVMDHHFEDPESFAEHWNDPARDAWQKPNEIVDAAGLAAGEIVVEIGR
ncbi:MAG: hypothetical protein AAF658_13020, partial [Myxococcota bacterium]